MGCLRSTKCREFLVDIGKVMKQIMGKVEAKGLDRKACDSFASVIWLIPKQRNISFITP